MADVYKKNKTYADAEGVKFQLDLVIVSCLNAFLHHKNWKVSSENKKAGKFDDIVIDLSDGTSILIQAKHKKNERNSITKEQFLSTTKNADFGLAKYFFSHEKIKSRPGENTTIICTNANVDKKGLEDILICHCIGPENMLSYEGDNCFFFTFNENFLPELKNSVEIYFQNHLQDEDTDKGVITDENMKFFLKNLQIFLGYPSGDRLQKTIETFLSRLNNISLWSNIFYHEIYRKIEDWFKQPVGEYLTDIRVKAMICEIKSDKYCESLKNYNISLEHNDFNFKESRIFHLTTEQGYLMQVLKIYDALLEEKSKRLFINPNENIETQKEILMAFEQRHYVFLIMVFTATTVENIEEISIKLREVLQKNQYKKVILVAELNNKLVEQIGLKDISQVDGSLSFADLSKNTQERLLRNKNIVFQGRTSNLEELLQTQTAEDCTESLNSIMLEKLVREEKVKVGERLLDLDEETARYYIPRTFEKENDELWRKEDVIPEESLFDVNQNVVLISDSAGLGKSTVLTKIAAYVKEKHSYLWVIRVNLTDYTRILRDCLRKNRDKINITELLNSKEATAMTNQFEELVFSMKEKVVLMLDGVDEISPDYTSLILDLISQCQKASNFAKIFVTTRPHMTLELKAVLQVESFKMLPFTRSNQVDFLVNYWTYNLGLTGINEDKCKHYAEILIDKMSSWIKSHYYWENTFTAIPLQVKMLGEIFLDNNLRNQSTDWEGCKEYLERDDVTPKLPEKFNIASLYSTFIEKKRDIYLSKENPSGNTATNTALLNHFEECLICHRSFALGVILEKSECDLFTNYNRSENNVKEYLLKIGIVQRLGDEFQFIHRTFAEYFVAESIIQELKIQNPNPEFYRLLIDDVLVHGRFEVVCAFLDILLQTVSLPSDIFKSYRAFAWQTNLNFVFQLARKGYVAIFQLILNSINFRIITGKVINVNDWPVRIIFNKRNTLNDLKVLVRIAGINIRNGRGETPLHSAVREGHLQMVNFLVQQGANVNVTDNDGRSALHVAVERNHLNTIKCLVECGADVNLRDNNGLTALHLAAECYHPNLVEYIVKQGAEINVRDSEGRAALHLAVRYNRCNTVQNLVRQGADVNVTDNDGLTALNLAIKYNRLDILQYLVDQGADVNIIDSEGCTPLHFAVKYDNLNIVKYLVEHCANINTRNKVGCTALSLSINRDLLTIAKYLVKHGADFNIRDNKGRTSLHLASESYRVNPVKFFVEQGADVNAIDSEGRTTLYLAVKHNRLETVKYLVEHGADINFKDNNSRTPVLWAAELDRLDIVKYFIEHGADINVRDSDGCTALQFADRKGNLNMVKYLNEVAVPNNSIVSDSYWKRLAAYLKK